MRAGEGFVWATEPGTRNHSTYQDPPPLRPVEAVLITVGIQCRIQLYPVVGVTPAGLPVLDRRPDPRVNGERLDGFGLSWVKARTVQSAINAGWSPYGRHSDDIYFFALDYLQENRQDLLAEVWARPSGCFLDGKLLEPVRCRGKSEPSGEA